MFEKYILKNLKPEEKTIKIIREYSLLSWGSYLIGFGLIVLAFFLLYPLIKWAPVGFLFFLLLFFLGIFIIIKRFVVWSFNVFLITNRRIVDFDQKGLFHKNVTETVFANIQDISYNKKGIFPTLLNYGNVVVKTASEETNLELKNVRCPAKVQQMLVNCQSKFSRKN